MTLQLVIVLLLSAAAIAAQSTKSPNILLVLTDDQDVELHGMFPMQQTLRLIGAAGATFTNAFTSTPVCCPARATLLSGMYAHNHGTINNTINGGCNGHKWRTKIEPHALPVMLQNLGYRTFYGGKYLNKYFGASVPKGWHEFHGLHGNSRYYNYTLRENDKNVSYNTEYLTDLLWNRTKAFLANNTEMPFFAMVAPPAAHAPFKPAYRHLGIFADVKALRTPNFNRVLGDMEKHWLVSHTNIISAATLSAMDTIFQRRWETLLAVDEMVASLVEQLEQSKQLDNTYIVYTSDNGYHVGQFAQPYDKRQPYETDIRVPMLVRGPGINANIKITAAVGLVDLAPTILDWAQASQQPLPSNLDGISLNKYLKNSTNYDALLQEDYKRLLLIQYWGEGNDATYNPACPFKRSDHLAQCDPEADCHCQDAWNNTYACVRDFRYRIDRIYCKFHDNENFVEAYDLNDDPYQMTNIGYDILPIEAALYDLALNNLTHCAGKSCNDAHV